MQRLHRFPSQLLAALTFSPAFFLPMILAASEPNAAAAAAVRMSIIDAGAVADGRTLNTAPIQTAIDKLAAIGGGTLVVPAGVFMSGALDLKRGVHLHLEKDAILRASNDMANFPVRQTRIEGRLQSFTPALINAENCDGLRITGEGTLDGNGRKIWDAFWARYKADPNTRNLDIARARLAFISNSKDVLVDGITFKDSQFWNLHFYRSRYITVRNARFIVPDDYRQAPSTDGIDVDSSQDVLIEGCYFSVTDDCIALKGSKGPFALDDKSPPVERVHITGCTFQRGHSALTLGSEATIVRDATLENSVLTGSMYLLNLKLRLDTPQHYEAIHCRGITLDASGGAFVSIQPWKQYTDLQGQPPPKSLVRNITFSNIQGRFGAFGIIKDNPQQTEIEDISFKDIELSLKKGRLDVHKVRNLLMENVRINGVSL